MSEENMLTFFCSSCKYEDDPDNCAFWTFEDLEPCPGYEKKNGKMKKLNLKEKRKQIPNDELIRQVKYGVKSINQYRRKQIPDVVEDVKKESKKTDYYKLIQKSEKCPLCTRPKNIGFMICWICHQGLSVLERNRLTSKYKYPQFEYLLNIKNISLETALANCGEVFQVQKTVTRERREKEKTTRVIDF